MTGEFYNICSEFGYEEVLNKENRPYNCILFQTHYDYFICVPFRTDIRHKNAFLFTGSKRSLNHKSGLDYSKLVIIKNSNFIDSDGAIVDTDEYKETIRNIETNEADLIINGYVQVGLIELVSADGEVTILQPNPDGSFSSVERYIRIENSGRLVTP